MPCTTRCEIDEILLPTECNIKGGVKSIYVARYGDIDWVAMETDPQKFDNTTQTVVEWVMNLAAVFKKWEFNRKLGEFNSTYTEESGLYENLITLIFEGNDPATRLSFVKSVNCCDLIVQIFDWNCQSRIFGVSFDGSSFLEIDITPLKIVRHLDSSGAFGGDKTRNEIDLGGEAVYAPLFATMPEADVPV